MKVVLWVFTGGSRHFADDITSEVFTSLAEANAAEAKWLEGNDEYDDDEDGESEGPWFGYVEKIEVDITDALIIR